jgi:(p)ppGpp synthase/HD superfamily hydrolase
MGILVKRALDLAAMWHEPQKRKYPGVAIPYMSHCAGVGTILARHGFDDDVVAAGVLHDALEDTGVTRAELEALFGERVATLVVHVSEEDKSLPWEERKQRYLAHFRVKPWEAQAITLADKIDNFESIIVCARHHGDPWSQFKRPRAQQLARFDALLSAALNLPAHPLIGEYEQTLALVRTV